MNFEEIAARILFEDNHLLAFNKPAGLLVQIDQKSETSLEILLKSYLKHRDQKPGNVFLGVIHRLDRPVSGLVVFAKTSKALARMNQLFKERDMLKTYWALVKTPPKNPSGVVKSYLWRNAKSNKTVSYPKEVPDSKYAETAYKLLARSDSWYLLEVKPHTGRHHQIRVHLAGLGCPIGGDLKYGSARSNKDGSISLHAESLQFEHPVTKEILTLHCPAPATGAWNYFPC